MIRWSNIYASPTGNLDWKVTPGPLPWGGTFGRAQLHQEPKDKVCGCIIRGLVQGKVLHGSPHHVCPGKRRNISHDARIHGTSHAQAISSRALHDFLPGAISADLSSCFRTSSLVVYGQGQQLQFKEFPYCEGRVWLGDQVCR
jgi:hypothetical protein